MTTRRIATLGLVLAIFGVGFALGRTTTGDLVSTAEAGVASVPQASQVFELRTYTAAEGKYDDLLARFRDHTMRIFEKHGMTNVGYWTPQDAPESGNTLIYLLAHDSREAAGESWSAFGDDPEWEQVAEESQRDGRLIVGLERVYLDATDFSPMK